jgi:murein DD-endopeptidase MepM/ murein hydrolase activator NlpD/muramidase (phage lysozyme)
MAISSPLTPKTSEKTIKNLQGIILNKTKVSRETFRNKTILQDRRIENDKRALQEEVLEAPDTVRRPGGAAQLIAGSAKGFFERLMGFLGYLTAGWLLSNLPTWIGMGKEFIARTVKMGNLIGGFLFNTTTIFNNLTSLLGATLTNIIAFDFLDTSGRVGTAFEELQLSVDNWGTGFEDALNLITSPLTEGVASGEDTPPPGTQYTDEGAYETPPSSGGTPAPQVMLEGGISGTTALLPAGAKGADPYIGATDRFGYSSSRGRQHNGIDIGTSGEKGYYVAFLLDGTATVRPNNGGAGNTVEIKSGGTTYKFFHLARFSISSGSYKAGTAIGEIGTTGSSTGIHLHYEVHPSGSRGVDPTPYLNLIKIGKSLGKPTPAPASVASSSTSQPQQNLMGTPSSSGSGRFGTKEEIALNDAISFAEGTKSSYGTMFGGGISKDLESGKLTVKQVIDLGDAHAKKNGRSGAAGRYQFMPPTLEDLVRTGDLKMDDKFTPQMQDKASIALARRRKVTSELLKKEGLSAKVSNMLAPEWASLPTYSGASYYGQPVKSLSSIQSAYKNSLGSPKQTQTQTPAQTSSPAPAQITSQSQSQSQISQSSQALTPERTGPTVIVTQNPSSPARQMMYSGGGGSSGGGSPQMSDFALLNNFIKNKLLLDLAYL